MGFFKGVGEFVGTVGGATIGTPVYLVGTLTKSKYLKDIADTTLNVSANTGKIFGTIADSTVKCASGIIHKDSRKAEEGMSEVLECSAKTVLGMGQSIKYTAEKGKETISAIVHGDEEKALKTGIEFAKIAAVSLLTVGICEFVGNVDLDKDSK